MLRFYDIALLIFHSGWIVFNLTGWIWRKTRPWQLVTLTLTFLSWIGLGIWYGWGYCPLTDWHWDVLRQLGAKDLPNSYVQYVLKRLFSITVSPSVADTLTIVLAVEAFLVSIVLNIRDRRRHVALNKKDIDR